MGPSGAWTGQYVSLLLRQQLLLCVNGCVRHRSQLWETKPERKFVCLSERLCMCDGVELCKCWWMFSLDGKVKICCHHCSLHGLVELQHLVSECHSSCRISEGGSDRGQRAWELVKHLWHGIQHNTVLFGLRSTTRPSFIWCEMGDIGTVMTKSVLLKQLSSLRTILTMGQL